MDHLILAIETSQRAGGVAVRDHAGTVLVELLRVSNDRKSGGGGGGHDDDLMPAIDRLMARANLKPRDLTAVGVSIGPGGFTGLRIGIVTAKILAETLGLNVASIPSAFVVAEALAPDITGPILVALASKKDTCWITRLERGDSSSSASAERPWRIGDTPGIADASSIEIDGIRALIADDHLPPAIRAACESARIPIHPPTWNPAACLAIAERMIAAGQLTDPLHLVPLYPRQPEAVTLWESKEHSERRT